MQYSVSFLTPGQVESHWDRLDFLVRSFLKHGGSGFSPADVKHMLLNNEALCYVVHQIGKPYVAIAVLRVVQYPQENVTQVFGVSGRDFDRWVDAIEAAIVSYAKVNKCAKVETYARHGMREKLLARNWKHVTNLMELAV